MKKAFTMMELIVVVIIISIIFGMAMPGFNKMKEDNKTKKAISNLRLMQAAERFYYVENSTYYPSSGTQTVIATINTNLKLSLSTTDTDWNYLVKDTGCVQATRNGDNNRIRSFLVTDDEAVTSIPKEVVCP